MEPQKYGSPRWNSVGKIYTAVFALWTAGFVVGFMVFLIHRKLPFIRLKNVPLLSFDLLVYPLNGSLPCALEYWIMSICLPLGIAVFQAQNMQLFCLFWGQKHLVWLRLRNSGLTGSISVADATPTKGQLHRCWKKWRKICTLKKTYIIIAVGTVMQILISTVIFLISRHFHPNYGWVSEPGAEFQCRAGWEWFPSGAWRAIWTYGFGPFILYKIRKIRDTHRWRLQTTLAILFSLPALPLWLSTWFTPKFYIMNSYWPPNLWFVPGLGAMEFVILLFPIFEIWRFKKRQRKVREEPVHTGFSKYSLAALEKALRDNIEQLEEFAATKDFTGENIVFLKRVRSWKEQWRSEVNSRNGEIPSPVFSALYNTAEEIFRTLVHREASDFPLNLDDDIYLALDQVFGHSTPGLRQNPSTDCFNTFPKAITAPFANDVAANARCLPERKGFREIRKKDSEAGAGVVAPEIDPDCSTPSRICSLKSTPLPWIAGDLETIFDGAEVVVKQMVLTNTWIRYVDSLPASERLFIGATPQISSPVSWRWRRYFWKKDSE
ncbi:hypothetical protein C7212DRAFT_344823 [Tuber magnatum]|uniref:RGS domain-containing protein n=1 Tax=Tuber magnatum TaxID=42249 RepID=A0A317SMB3_9PEZI|nr:hypothetical protein C7212DRAFT_344823 [Tuber magnatum]